jgi:hypothetical protein
MLTHPSVMGEDVRNQKESWLIYDSFLQDDRVSFDIEAEPQQIESAFRRFTLGGRSLAQQ